VLPLRLADGREVPVLPLICLDDMDASLAISGARLGAQAILTMSNDSWFTATPLGAQMHQAAAAFRSIETRLPQFRATTNGYSAVIDATGSVLAGTRMGERTLVIANVTVRNPTPTLMVMWGNWVGRAALAWLLVLAACSAFPLGRLGAAQDTPAPGSAIAWPLRVAVLPPMARIAAGVLRTLARCGLCWMCVALLLDDALRANTLGQVRMFATLFLFPEASAWVVLLFFSAKASLEDGCLVLTRGAQRLALPLAEIAHCALWPLPIPSPGLSLQLAGGKNWRYALALSKPDVLAAAIAAAGGPTLVEHGRKHPVMQVYLQASLAIRRTKFDSPLAKYLLLPLILAIPAFHLQQHIAYGGAFGEYYAFGLRAYLTAFALWWAAWSIGVVLSEALLRAAIETGTLLTALLRPARAVLMRQGLERLGHAALFLGLPAWLFFTVYAA
jgi:apolipoprotein N-acyltransferase